MPDFATRYSSSSCGQTSSIDNAHLRWVRASSVYAAKDSSLLLGHILHKFVFRVLGLVRERRRLSHLSSSSRLSEVSWRSSNFGVRRNEAEALFEASSKSFFRSEQYPPLHRLLPAPNFPQLTSGWLLRPQEHLHPHPRWHARHVHRLLSCGAAFSSSWSGCLV